MSADLSKYPSWPLALEKLGEDKWRLLKNWMYLTRSGMVLLVPAGFVCDLASIPRIAWQFVGSPADSAEAAVLHDYVYAKGPDIYAEVDGLLDYLDIVGNPSSIHNQGVLREWADSMYYNALRDMGKGRVNAKAQFRAVRWWGWWPWYEHRITGRTA